MKGIKETWVIDVCRTCGVKASWPFCAHRDMPAPAQSMSWCESVVVTGTWHPAEGHRG